jgi:hypothetical protein
MTQEQADRTAAMRKWRYLWPPMSDEFADGVISHEKMHP